MNKEDLKDMLSFSRRQKRGIIVLIFLIFGLVISVQLLDFLPATAQIDMKQFEGQIKELTEKIRVNDSLVACKRQSYKKDYPLSYESNNKYAWKKKNTYTKTTITPFEFDPNTIDSSGLLKLGFSDKQAHSILNFRNKGGKFYKKEDFKKIYVVSNEAYSILKNYIRIDEKSRKINLNTASREELKSVTGIGDYTSKQIIIYREKLGGFTHTDQIFEIYGVKRDFEKKIKDQVYIAKEDCPKKIKLNDTDYQHLKKHPYIDEALAAEIISYRNKKGKIRSLKEFKRLNNFDSIRHTKLIPYLSVKRESN